MKYCTHCGTQVSDDAAFCPACGKNLTVSGEQNTQANTTTAQNGAATPTSQMTWFDKATAWISKLAGGSEAVRPPLKSIFSKIFVKHQEKEADELFICGTSTTTPELTDDGKSWPAPWLWSRIFVVFAAAFLLLYLCCTMFENINAYPGLMVIGSFAVPVSVMIFFFELNTPKNISFYNTIKYFLLGGVSSLVLTLILYEILGSIDDVYLQAMLIGIIEELGKLGIIVLIIWKSKGTAYSLNGLLIGAAIGAGFAAFESAGYAFQVLLGTLSYDEMVGNILLRAFLAPGGHVIWAAMSGYAVMLVKRKTGSVSFFNQPDFWKIFWIPFVLHAVWDMPLVESDSVFLQLLPVIINMIVGWVVTFVLIGNSLSQIGEILQKRKNEAATESPESLTPTSEQT